MDNLEYHEGVQKSSFRKKLSKSKKMLLRLFLKSDIKNPGMRSELRKIKKSLIRNIDGANVHQDDLHSLFWLYAHHNKDVYIPFHLHVHTRKFFVHVSHIQCSVADYLQLLKIIRHAFVPIKMNFDRRRNHALKAAKIAVKDDLADGTEFGQENYKHALTTSLDTLYQRTVTPDLLQRKQEDIIIDIANGHLGVFKTTEYVALMSYFFNGFQQVQDFFAPYMDTTLDIGFPEPLLLSQLFAILESLDLSSNLFPKL